MNPLIITLVLATATPGGGFPVYGDAYAEMLSAQEPTLRIVARYPRGLSHWYLGAYRTAIGFFQRDVVRISGR